MGVVKLSTAGILDYQKYSSFLAGNAAYSPGSYDLLETEILTGSQASVTFDVTGLGSTYQHLQIRATARTDRADYQDKFAIQLNGVTSSVYISHALDGDGGTVASRSQNLFDRIFTVGEFDLFAANETSNFYGAGVFDFLDFASANKTTTVRYLSGMAGGTQAKSINLVSGMNPNDTSALTSVTMLTRYSANYVAGSRFSLYGIKGA